jgi:hypothetical protein
VVKNCEFRREGYRRARSRLRICARVSGGGESGDGGPLHLIGDYAHPTDADKHRTPVRSSKESDIGDESPEWTSINNR